MDPTRANMYINLKTLPKTKELLTSIPKRKIYWLCNLQQGSEISIDVLWQKILTQPFRGPLFIKKKASI